MKNRLSFGIALLSLGCAPMLQSHDDAGHMDGGWQRNDASIPASSGSFSHSIGADGVVTTLVDATSATAWRYLDFETGLSVDPASTTWDLGFSRFRVRTNGGVSGNGRVQVAVLDGRTFESITQAP